MSKNNAHCIYKYYIKEARFARKYETFEAIFKQCEPKECAFIFRALKNSFICKPKESNH